MDLFKSIKKVVVSYTRHESIGKQYLQYNKFDQSHFLQYLHSDLRKWEQTKNMKFLKYISFFGEFWHGCGHWPHCWSLHLHRFPPESLEISDFFYRRKRFLQRIWMKEAYARSWCCYVSSIFPTLLKFPRHCSCLRCTVKLMNAGIDKQPFLTLTEKTYPSDFLQLRQQNAKILTNPQSTSNDQIVLFQGNNNTFLQSDHSSI